MDNIEKIKGLVTNNLKIKPSEVQSSVVLSAFRGLMDWEIVKKESRSIVDKRKISCTKEKSTNMHNHVSITLKLSLKL